MAAKKERGKGVKRRELSWHLLCADLLYTFKAAHRAARAANTARTPPLPLALPLRRRQRRSAGAKIIKLGPPLTYDGDRGSPRAWGASMLPQPILSGSGRTRQERLRRRLRRSSTLDRTCPKVPEFAAIGRMDASGQDELSNQRISNSGGYTLVTVSASCAMPEA